MRSREYVVLVEEGTTAVKLSVVHQPCHPGIAVHSSGNSTYYPGLLVSHATLCNITHSVLVSGVITQLKVGRLCCVLFSWLHIL